MNNILQTSDLYNDIAKLIEQGKKQLSIQVNSTMTLIFWQVGYKINTHILDNQRAEYGKQIVSALTTQLVDSFGKSFEERNLRRMMQFSEQFTDLEFVIKCSKHLSWTHFVELLPLKNEDEKLFYIQKIIEEKWTTRETRRQIEQKCFERSQIANFQITVQYRETDFQNTFKDPYFLDFLGLKDGYLENDLETALIKELERFILELGKGFASVERQKRMIIDGEDFYLDL